MKKMNRLAGIMAALLTMSLLTGCFGQEVDPFAQNVEPDPVKPAVDVTDVNVEEPDEKEPEPEPV